MSNFSKKRFKQTQFNSIPVSENLIDEEVPASSSVEIESIKLDSVPAEATETKEEVLADVVENTIAPTLPTPTLNLEFQEAERRRRRLLGYN
jgi:hypothetical protein